MLLDEKIHGKKYKGAGGTYVESFPERTVIHEEIMVKRNDGSATDVHIARDIVGEYEITVEKVHNIPESNRNRHYPKSNNEI